MHNTSICIYIYMFLNMYVHVLIYICIFRSEILKYAYKCIYNYMRYIFVCVCDIVFLRVPRITSVKMT